MLDKLLAEAELSKRQLAKRLGINEHTVGRWGNEPPQYAIAYLDLYISIKVLWADLSKPIK